MKLELVVERFHVSASISGSECFSADINTVEDGEVMMPGLIRDGADYVAVIRDVDYGDWKSSTTIKSWSRK